MCSKVTIISLLVGQDGVEPIWATAARNDISFATFLWGRCDIPYDGVKRYSPAFCENYYTMDRTKTLTINVDNAMRHLMNGVDAAIVSHRKRNMFVKLRLGVLIPRSVCWSVCLSVCQMVCLVLTFLAFLAFLAFCERFLHHCSCPMARD